MQRSPRIVLGIWIISLLLCAAVWFSVYDRITFEKEQAIHDAGQEVTVLSKAFEEHVRRSLDGIDNSLRFLQNRMESRDQVSEGVHAMLRLLRTQPLLHTVGIADATGEIIANAHDMRSAINIKDSTAFRHFRESTSTELFIGQPTIGRTTKRISVHLARRISYPDGSFGGMVFAAVNPHYFSRFYEQMNLGPSYRVTLIGTDGVIRARNQEINDAVGQNISNSLLFEKLKHQSAGLLRSPGMILTDQIRINAYRQLADYPLIVYVGQSERHALQPSDARAANYYFAAIVLSFFILGSAGLLARVIRQNLSLLSGVQLALGQREAAEDLMRKHMTSLEKSAYQTVRVLASVAEMHDPYTAGHQQRSAVLSVAIGKQLGLSDDKIEELRVVAAIHDVGKLSVPGEILSKPARLSPLEFELAQTHSQAGYDILKNVDLPWNLAEIVLQHHERYDGSGYPQGLTGDNILLEARILAVADSVEAMLSHRPYRPALDLEETLTQLKALSAISYDPTIVDACLRVFRETDFSLTDI